MNQYSTPPVDDMIIDRVPSVTLVVADSWSLGDRLLHVLPERIGLEHGAFVSLLHADHHLCPAGWGGIEQQC